MKHNLLSFTVEPMKPRNRVAQDLLDRNGPYKPKRIKSVDGYQRREKHRHRVAEYWSKILDKNILFCYNKINKIQAKR